MYTYIVKYIAGSGQSTYLGQVTHFSLAMWVTGLSFVILSNIAVTNILMTVLLDNINLLMLNFIS